MEVIMNPMKISGAMRRAWRRRRYSRVEGGARKAMKVARFGTRRTWRVKAAVPRLRWRMLSPARLWAKFKNAYVRMMLAFSGKVGGYIAGGGVKDRMGQKRVLKAREGKMGYSRSEFENRLIYEIYKSLVPSMELYPTS